MKIEELKEKYGYMFNIIEYDQLKWYQKIFYKIRSTYRNIFWRCK